MSITGFKGLKNLALLKCDQFLSQRSQWTRRKQKLLYKNYSCFTLFYADVEVCKWKVILCGLFNTSSTYDIFYKISEVGGSIM